MNARNVDDPIVCERWIDLHGVVETLLGSVLYVGFLNRMIFINFSERSKNLQRALKLFGILTATKFYYRLGMNDDGRDPILIEESTSELLRPETRFNHESPPSTHSHSPGLHHICPVSRLMRKNASSCTQDPASSGDPGPVEPIDTAERVAVAKVITTLNSVRHDVRIFKAESVARLLTAKSTDLRQQSA